MKIILTILCVLLVNSGCSSARAVTDFSANRNFLDSSEVILDRRNSFLVQVPGTIYNAMNIAKTKLLRMGYDRELPTHSEEKLLVMVSEASGTQVFIFDEPAVKIIMMEFEISEEGMVDVIFYRDIKDGVINKEVDVDIEMVRDLLMSFAGV